MGFVSANGCLNKDDGSELADAMGLDADEIARRKSFNRFDEEDAARLADLAPTFDRVAENVESTSVEAAERAADGEATADPRRHGDS